MAQYTSEEALNGIFNLLSQMADERQHMNTSNDTGDMIS